MGSIRTLANALTATLLATGLIGLVRAQVVAGARRADHQFLNPTKPIHAVAFSPDGALIACGGDDRILRVYDSSGLQRWATEPGYAAVYSVAFSPDGLQVASAGPDRLEMAPWSLMPLPVKPGFVTAATPEGRGPRAWGGKPIHQIKGLVPKPKEGRIGAWDASSGRLIQALDGLDRPIHWVTFIEQEPRILGFDDHLDARIWRRGDGRLAASSEKAGILPGRALHPNLLTSASGSGLRFASADPNLLDGFVTLQLWDASRSRYEVNTDKLAPAPSTIAVRPDGQRFATARTNGDLTIWDFDAGKVVAEYRTTVPKARWADAIVYSPDGGRIAAADEGGSIRIWDGETGKIVRTYDGFRTPVRAIAFLPSGIRVVGGGYFAPGSKSYPPDPGGDAEPLILSEVRDD